MWTLPRRDRGMPVSMLLHSATVRLRAAPSQPGVLQCTLGSPNGPTSAAITGALPEGTSVMDKAVFGANDNPPIDSAVRAHGRSTVVLVGTETDVCVAHSAMGWQASGLRVLVVHDAVYSAGNAHENGLMRLRQEGVELLSAKELYYEWLRTLANVRDFDAENPDLASPPGFSL